MFGSWPAGLSGWVSVMSGRPLGIAVLSFVWLVACGGTRIGHFSAASAAIAVLAAGPEGGDQTSLRVLIQRTGKPVAGGVCIVAVHFGCETTSWSVEPQERGLHTCCPVVGIRRWSRRPCGIRWLRTESEECGSTQLPRWL